MKKYIILTLGLFILSSCTQEYLNPNTASEQQVVTSQSGLLAMVNGLQQKFTTSRAGSMYSLITADGLTTGQLKVLNAGNTDEVLLESGGTALINSNAILNNLWNQSNLTKSNADLIISNIDNAPDPAIKSGILSAAHIFRALSLGTLATFWESAPIEVTTNAPFVPRSQLLAEAINSLNVAISTLNATTPSSAFYSNFVGSINLLNTANALKARYQLMSGNNAEAIAAANLVNETVKSGFDFNDISPNPIFFSSFGNRNVTEPNLNFGLPNALTPADTDGRKSFYYSAGGSVNLGNAGFFNSNSATIPIYLPGEIALIKAEANARLSNLDEAVNQLNIILTKNSDPWGVAAGMTTYNGPKTQEDILTEIYKQRGIELFLSGLRLEDSRRFNRPTSERNRNWYPYPLSERNNNTNTPADPVN